MRLHFLGGANEVGASATLIEIGDRRILVDAGIRVRDSKEFPDFSFVFKKVGMPDAVLLTHAHTDHTGALPILERELLSGVKTYCTPPTPDMVKVLLDDQVNREQDDEALRYTSEEVEAALGRMKRVPWTKPQPICEGITARWIRAGHILGAGMIYIESRSESILMTGDVSATPQLTVPSVEVPSWCKKPDVMVIESTYGNSHPKDGNNLPKSGRKRMANGLVKAIRGRLAVGGKVLIPVFSIGRAQEVILILKDAMARKKLRRCPVYVDGMVRKINAVYSDHKGEFPKMPKSLRCKGNSDKFVFYFEDMENRVKAVGSESERDRILKGDPCVIVASSGMLNGGISNFYADRLVCEEKNLIAITGYQAKGTPGSELKHGGDWKLTTLTDSEPIRESKLKHGDDSKRKNGESIPVECHVERYSLSAHAHQGQLLILVTEVDADKVFLVHGDKKARNEFSEAIAKERPNQNITLPKNGETYREERRIGIAEGREVTPEDILSEVSDFLRKTQEKEPFRVREIAEIWFGTKAINPLKVQFVEWCLSIETRFFERISKDEDKDEDEDRFRLRPAL